MVQRIQPRLHFYTSSFSQYLTVENIFLIKNGLDTSLLRHQALGQGDPLLVYA
jgi:hypothetical protein